MLINNITVIRRLRSCRPLPAMFTCVYIRPGCHASCSIVHTRSRSGNEGTEEMPALKNILRVFFILAPCLLLSTLFFVGLVNYNNYRTAVARSTDEAVLLQQALIPRVAADLEDFPVHAQSVRQLRSNRDEPANCRAAAEAGEGEGIVRQPYKSWNRSVVTFIQPEIPRNCNALFRGEVGEISKVAEAQKNWKSSTYNKIFNKLYIDTYDCQKIRNEFEGNFYVSEEEKSFPLAFSMTIHDDAQQIVRFLKAIYRPHNVYCIHYDKKSSWTLRKIMDRLTKCLRNVIIPKKIVNIVYECYPILEAQLSCMRELVKVRNEFPWKYTTTLCGKEVPLRTNREMVHLLKQMNGLPALLAHNFTGNEKWVKLHHMIIKKNICKRTSKIQNKPIPYGMNLLKSMAYFSLTPEFTNFVLNSPEGKALYEYLKPVKGPEEAFFGTLLHYWINGKLVIATSENYIYIAVVVIIMHYCGPYIDWLYNT